jgi:hypothetical protein
MKLKVFKYCIDGKFLELPVGARVLTAKEQGNDICIWAEVDPSAELETRIFSIVETGKDIPQNASYVGTAFLFNGSYVAHVYEISSEVQH